MTALEQLDRKITPTLLHRADDFGGLKLAFANDAISSGRGREAKTDASEISRLYAAQDGPEADRGGERSRLLRPAQPGPWRHP